MHSITKNYNLVNIVNKCRSFFAQIFEILPQFLTNQTFEASLAPSAPTQLFLLKTETVCQEY